MEQDEGFARRALQLLDEEPDWPSLVNIQRAVADGRRLERRRTAVRVSAATVAVGLVAGGVGAAVALGSRTGPDLIAVPPTGPAPVGPSAAASVAAQAPPAPTSCTVNLLPVPKGAKTVRMMGGDPSGRYLVGSAIDGAGHYHALLWTDGDLRVLDDATADVDGIAVNASGTVAWSAGPSAYEYRDGKVSPLPAANGYRVMRIDPAGDVYALDERDVYRGPPASGAPGTKPGNGAQRLLTVSAGGSSSVRDLQQDDTLGPAAVLALDDDGTAVGLAAVGSGPIGNGNSHAAVWHAGTMSVLTPPDAGYAARPAAIADGWVGGESWSLTVRTPDAKTGSLPGTGVRWNLRTGAAERISGLSTVSDINRYGWAVGRAPDGRSVAAFGDRVVRLPDPAGADPNVATGSMVTTVSDDGRVVGGEAFLRADGPTPVRWTCD
jgi:hypothetical protein